MDSKGEQYSNESILKGIIHHSKFDGGFFGGGSGGFIGKGKRAEVIKSLGFSDRPTQGECWSKMQTVRLEAYPGHSVTVHKDLVQEVQDIYKELKELGVELNDYQGSYCYRPIRNPNHPSTTLSMHSFGCALDLNYNLNPFKENTGPLSSGDDTRHGVVRTVNSPIVQVFAKYGWGWGGRYGDYMHFSKANGG